MQFFYSQVLVLLKSSRLRAPCSALLSISCCNVACSYLRPYWPWNPCSQVIISLCRDSVTCTVIVMHSYALLRSLQVRMRLQSERAAGPTHCTLLGHGNDGIKLSIVEEATADRHWLLQGWRIVRVAICAPWQLLQRRRLRRIGRLLRRLLLLPCWQLRPRLLRGSQPCGLDGLHWVGRGPGHARRGARSRGGREWSKPDRTQTSLRSSSLSSASPSSSFYAKERAANGTGLHAKLVPSQPELLLISPRPHNRACTKDAALGAGTTMQSRIV